MQTTLKEPLNELLAKLGEELDIPDDIYQDAVIKYRSVGAWLEADGSALKQYDPEIFPQGSFRLGTAVRSNTEDGEYDIDLVCRLKIEKESITQKELKHKIGDRLKQHDEYKAMLEESRRCWRLNYPQQFHMDVLPSLPNRERLPDGILLTDKVLPRWQRSNPKTYANWFYECMRVMVIRGKEVILKAESSTYKSIEEVPEWKVRTPLQRAVQILKRHRDIYFTNDYENCPVSIILTTLAAKAYNNQDNIFDAIVGIVHDMPNHIVKHNGKWWVLNPAEPEENFADKWNEKPVKYKAFRLWLERVREDFEKALNSYSLSEACYHLAPVLGMSDVGIVAKSFGIDTRAFPLRKHRAKPQIPPLGDTRHVLSLPWPVQISYRATLAADVYLPNGKRLWKFDRFDYVPKNIKIRFEVKTNALAPYLVQWQVTNTGAEAEKAQGLRGDFYESDARNSHVRWEPTAYTGTHLVEALIIKNGVCVARSGKKPVKIR